MIFLLLFLQEYLIRGLNPFSQYLISLQVFNPAGRGPATTVAVMTDEGGKNLLL